MEWAKASAKDRDGRVLAMEVAVCYRMRRHPTQGTLLALYIARPSNIRCFDEILEKIIFDSAVPKIQRCITRLLKTLCCFDDAYRRNLQLSDEISNS